MITSMANSRIKQLVLLRDKSRVRNKEGLFLAEGIKMFEEAAAERIKEIYCAESFERQLFKGALGERTEELLKKLESCKNNGVFVETISDELFKKVSDTKTPQGILFLMEQFHYSVEELLKKAEEKWQQEGWEPLFLLLEDIQDPGNLGTMLRTSEGAGVSGIIMSKNTVDIYNPKTIRSTMGSLYRVPFVYTDELSKEIEKLQEAGITVYAAHLEGKLCYDEKSYEGGSAFLIGNEGNGLKRETADMADGYVKIPMEGSLESLNAAVAAALLLYRASGCRRKRRACPEKAVL